jgi:hypothetical protein
MVRRILLQVYFEQSERDSLFSFSSKKDGTVFNTCFKKRLCIY